MHEIWKDIPGYNGKYCVSNLGNVMSRNYLNTGIDRPLVLKKHHSGYIFVRLCNGAGVKQKNITVHRLVANAFIPNPLNKPCVNHIDGNKANNRVDNLEWVTYKENTEHAIEHGLQNPHNNNRHGKGNSNSRKVCQFTKTGVYIRDWNSISEAARHYGAKPSTIINNIKGRLKSACGYVWKYAD